jgi:hypothetical protein
MPASPTLRVIVYTKWGTVSKCLIGWDNRTKNYDSDNCTHSLNEFSLYKNKSLNDVLDGKNSVIWKLSLPINLCQ